MKVIYIDIGGVGEISPAAACVATIGNFDGIHLGHQALLKELLTLAAHYNLPSALITFEPMPTEFFLKDKAPKRITRFEEKLEILEHFAVDLIYVLPFTETLAGLSAEDFIQHILVEKLGVKHLVVGQDFRFGRNRLGDIHLLQSTGATSGFGVSIAPLLLVDGQRVSSSSIREALASGDKKAAESLLARKLIDK